MVWSGEKQKKGTEEEKEWIPSLGVSEAFLDTEGNNLSVFGSLESSARSEMCGTDSESRVCSSCVFLTDTDFQVRDATFGSSISSGLGTVFVEAALKLSV